MRGKFVAPNLDDKPYSWVFHFPPALQEGARFSTNAEANPRFMWSWADRVDGGIDKGRLYFLCFKKSEATSGRMITPNGQHWFDGKCWDVYDIPRQR